LLQPAELRAVAERQDEVAAVPDGPSAARAVAAEPAEAAAARPFGAVVAEPPVAGAALASPSAEPDAAAGAEAQPGAAVPPAELAAVSEASMWPAERASKAPRRAAVAAEAEARLAFAPFPARPVFLPEPEPNRRLWVGPPQVPAHSSPAGLAGRVSRWDGARPERGPSHLAAPEARLSRPAPATHWPSATPAPEAAH
jgi:hypothetical protein